MTTTSLLSELEAINIVLTAGDESPVQSLSDAGNYPLTLAKNVLNDVVRTVQGMGWAFNTEYNFPLTRDSNGFIQLAPNILSLDVDDGFNVDAVQRGSTLYDRFNHTSVFTSDLTGTVIFLLPWEQIPQPARQYIATRAARSFQARVQAGDSPFAMTQQDEQMALLVLQSYEADTADANFLTDSYSVASVLAGRY